MFVCENTDKYATVAEVWNREVKEGAIDFSNQVDTTLHFRTASSLRFYRALHTC